MMCREVKYLTKTGLFKKFIDKYDLQFIISNKKIYLVSSCFVVEIYGYCTENHFYFDVYPIDLKTSSNIGRLLYDKDKSNLRKIYEVEKQVRLEVLLEKLESSLEATLKAEQHFFTYIKVMDNFLSDFLRCNFNYSLDFFDSVIESKKGELKRVLNSLTKQS